MQLVAASFVSRHNIDCGFCARRIEGAAVQLHSGYDGSDEQYICRVCSDAVSALFNLSNLRDFDSLPLGARFSYVDRPDQIWVRVQHGDRGGVVADYPTGTQRQQHCRAKEDNEPLEVIYHG